MDQFPLDLNSDGLAHTWAGTSLWNSPLHAQSMTLFTSENPNLFWFSHFNYFDTVRRYDFRLEEPYLDQPPFALPIFGVLPTLFGYTAFEPVPEVLIRLPAIFFSAITLTLTHLLAKKLFSSKVALLSVIALGLTPYFIFAHREAFLENILTPLYLGGLLSLLQYLDKKDKRWLALTILLTFLAPLTKVVGVVLAAIIGFWLIKEKKYQETSLVIAAGVAGIACYFVYGWLVHPEQFSWILSIQSTRGVYAGSFIDFILNAGFYKPFVDGWYLLHFFTFGWLAFSSPKKNSNFITITAALIICSIIGTAGVNNNFPWYRHPLFPFFSIATGIFLEQVLMGKINLAGKLLFVFLAFANLSLLTTTFPILANSALLRLGLLAIIGVFTLAELFPQPKFAKLSSALIAIILSCSLIINAAVILFYPKSLCVEVHCKTPTKIVIPKNQ